MEEGYYWIQFDGKVQIACYFNQIAEDIVTGEMVIGGWELFGVNGGIINTSAVEVLSTRLQLPA